MNDETDRAILNPENFLMSDSLDGRFNAELLVENDTDEYAVVPSSPQHYGQFICDFCFEDVDITGVLTSFIVSQQKTSITIRGDAGDIVNLLGGDNALVSVSCRAFSGEDLLLKEFVDPIETEVHATVLRGTDDANIVVSFTDVRNT